MMDLLHITWTICFPKLGGLFEVAYILLNVSSNEKNIFVFTPKFIISSLYRRWRYIRDSKCYNLSPRRSTLLLCPIILSFAQMLVCLLILHIEVVPHPKTSRMAYPESWYGGCDCLYLSIYSEIQKWNPPNPRFSLYVVEIHASSVHCSLFSK